MDALLLKGFANVNIPLKSRGRSGSRLTQRVSRILHPAFHQEYVKVCRHGLGANLPHHQRNLSAMVSGMVRHVLH